jgi:spore coat polysaccharide biosynthesis protein SpsF
LGRVVAIIQARIGSTRLPGKVLEDVGGRTMLARVVRRVRRATLLDAVVVATTERPADDAITAECAGLDVAVFRGSEPDVLDRYCQAARTHAADTIVRITSDCPLADPTVLDGVVRAYASGLYDYASNFLERRHPRGLDTEVIRRSALERAWGEANQPHHRAHVTPYIYENPECFRLLSVPAESDLSAHRWTVDTPEDLHLVRELYARLGNDDHFGWQEVLALVEREPALAALNRGVVQKATESG